MNDFLFALRQFRKHPGYAAAAIFSLAVGAGLNVVMFTMVDQSGLRTLPVREPDRIVSLHGADEEASFAYLDRIDFRDRCRGFEDVVAVSDDTAIADYLEIPRRLHANIVSRNYFTCLGVTPAQGRIFAETDAMDLQAEPVVVISYNLWQRDFGSDPGVVGRTVPLNGQSVTVLGVAPKGFAGLRRWAPEDLWYPAETWHARMPRLLTARTFTGFRLLARLKPGVASELAAQEVNAVVPSLARSRPDPAQPQRLTLHPITPRHGVAFVLEVLATMALPGLVLAIACANVSGLLLARAQIRAQEIAVRLALGSGRLRLARQMLAESLLLATLGAAVGLVLAVWAVDALPSLLPPSVEQPFPAFYVDLRVIAFAVGTALFATMVSGLTPALYALRTNLIPLLKADTSLAVPGRRRSGLALLVIGQMAVSLVLLVLAGAFVRHWLQGYQTQAGFRLPDLLLADLRPVQYGMNKTGLAAYVRAARERISSLPGVKRACVAGAMPLEYLAGWHREVTVSESAEGMPARKHRVACNPADPEVLRIIGCTLLRGRGFEPSDTDASERVAVISRAAAEQFWPGEDPLGRQVRFGGDDTTYVRVVGMVEDGPYNLYDSAHRPYLFVPVEQTQMTTLSLLVETSVPAVSMLKVVREELRRLDDRVRPVSLQTLHQRLVSSYAMFGRGLMARVFGAFGALGLALAAIGLYAVIAHVTAQRTRELGLRLAVGASRADILWLVLRRGLRLALIGVAVGLPLALACLMLMTSGWVGFKGFEPLTCAGVVLVLVTVASAASLAPAWRAARLDPAAVLRHD